MKACVICRIEKSDAEFRRHRRQCKQCVAVKARAYQQQPDVKKAQAIKDAERWAKNKVALLAGNKAWREANKEIVRQKVYAWKTSNPHAINAIAKRSREKHFDRVMARNGQRRAITRQATPSWANMFFVAEAYRLARLRTKITGIKWSVDHIVPLKNKMVCGLHVEANLRVIPATINSRKTNKFIEELL